jgi:magnesium chelatase family protein
VLDRLDLQVEVPALDPAELRRPRDVSHCTAALRQRIAAARRLQTERNSRHGARPVPNARLGDRSLELACAADSAVEDSLEQVLRLSRAGARSRVRLLRVARTVADLDEREELRPADVLEAAALRGFARAPAVQ